MFYELNTKPESINIFTWWCIHSPFPLRRSYIVLHSVLCELCDSMCECLELDGSVLGERVCIYFASIFTIYNYISSPFAYDALKPFIYCHWTQWLKILSVYLRGNEKESFTIATSNANKCIMCRCLQWKWRKTNVCGSSCSGCVDSCWLCRLFCNTDPLGDVRRFL